MWKPVDICAEPHIVPPTGPIEIRHVLVLRVVAVIRHVVGIVAGDCEIAGALVKLKLRPAAFKPARAVSAGDAQYIPSDILIQALLLGAGTLLGKPEVGVHNQGWGERVGPSKCRTVRLALPVARIAAASDRYPL